jgi:hypothetical protein
VRIHPILFGDSLFFSFSFLVADDSTIRQTPPSTLTNPVLCPFLRSQHQCLSLSLAQTGASESPLTGLPGRNVLRNFIRRSIRGRGPSCYFLSIRTRACILSDFGQSLIPGLIDQRQTSRQPLSHRLLTADIDLEGLVRILMFKYL